MKQFRHREWGEILDSWIEHTPTFSAIAVPPDPGLEHFQPLLDIKASRGRLPDIPGLRAQTLWEAVFLFHKCAHTNLAAQRLGLKGMHSWSLFNAYHSAYLGARGLMALLGVAFPELNGHPVAIDLFPEPTSKKRGVVLPPQEFMILDGMKMEHQNVWEAFQRIIRISKVPCWDPRLHHDLSNAAHEKFSPPRNRFLYRTAHWPLNDLASDMEHPDMVSLLGEELDPGEAGFLLRLSFSVFRLFEQLMDDLANYSGPVKEQVNASRFRQNSELQELSCYKKFIETVGLAT